MNFWIIVVIIILAFSIFALLMIIYRIYLDNKELQKRLSCRDTQIKAQTKNLDWHRNETQNLRNRLGKTRTLSDYSVKELLIEVIKKGRR